MIIYDFLEVPWGLGRLPWVPGAPPGGSLGGVPGPMSAGQFSKHAHGCLGAWEGGPVVPGPPPWVPGAPPGGSLGGVPGPMSAGQFRSGPIGFRIKIYVDLDVDFWSYWGRSWVPLGCHFRSFWRLGPPKLVPKPFSNRLNIEQVIFPKNERHRGREHDFEVQVGPRWHPRRPKIAPRRVQDRLGSVFLTVDFSPRF